MRRTLCLPSTCTCFESCMQQRQPKVEEMCSDSLRRLVAMERSIHLGDTLIRPLIDAAAIELLSRGAALV